MPATFTSPLGTECPPQPSSSLVPTMSVEPWLLLQDRSLLRTEPLASKFLMWKSSMRSVRLTEKMRMPLLEEIKDSKKAFTDANDWLIRAGRDESPHENVLKWSQQNLLVFVNFHWEMFINNKSNARKVLMDAREKWGCAEREKPSRGLGKKARGGACKSPNNRVMPKVEDQEVAIKAEDIPASPTEVTSKSQQELNKKTRRKEARMNDKSKARGASAEHGPSETIEDNGMYKAELTDGAHANFAPSSSSTLVSDDTFFMSTPSSSHSTLVNSPGSVSTLVDVTSVDFVEVDACEPSKHAVSSKRKAARTPSPPDTPTRNRHALPNPRSYSDQSTERRPVTSVFSLHPVRWTSVEQEDLSVVEVPSTAGAGRKTKKKQRVGDSGQDGAEGEAPIKTEVDNADATLRVFCNPTPLLIFPSSPQAVTSVGSKLDSKKRSQTEFFMNPSKETCTYPSVTGRRSSADSVFLSAAGQSASASASASTSLTSRTEQLATVPPPPWGSNHPRAPPRPKTSNVRSQGKKKTNKVDNEPPVKRSRLHYSYPEHVPSNYCHGTVPFDLLPDRAESDTVVPGRIHEVKSVFPGGLSFRKNPPLNSSSAKRKRGQEHPALAPGKIHINLLPSTEMVQYGHPIQPRPTIKKPLLSRFLRPKTVREERGSLPVIEAKMQEIGAGAQEHHHHKKDIRHIPVDEFEVEAETDDQATVELPDDELRIFVVDSVEPPPTLPPPKKEALPKVLKPHVWAQSRQEVCESYDHFRSYQGGVYFNKDVARGYLLSAFSSSRDKFHREGRLIISHGGGKAEAFHTHNGRMEREAATDQSSEDKSVRALLNNYYSRRPLVLLADDKYALFPYDLTAAGYTYVVLGFYWITNAWAECQHVEENGSKVVRFKFAFQWCEEQGDPWWCMRPQSKGTVGPQSQGEASPAVVKNEETGEVFLPFSALPNEQRCDRCCRTSIQVYEIGWMCLTPKCPSFWIHEGKMPTSDLEYSRRFLDTAPVRKGHPCTTDKLLPSPPPSHSVGGVVTTRQFARGMYCRKCGRLSSRARWDCWECKGCRAVHRVTGMIRDHKQFWTQLSKLDFYDHTITRGSGIWAEPTRFITFKEDGENRRLMVQTFTLPHNRGKIHIIPGSVLTNGKANGIFSEYQEMANKGEIDFRRWPMRAHRCRGELLTNYFSQNTGAPYKYVGGAGRTVPLEDGPSAVRHALRLMKRRIRHALGRKIPFNEVLSAAYMERQKMAFHSDSERGLGPVVASLSLGSVALMHFRLHPQHATSPALRKTALTIALKHGDVLVMDGHDVQTYYEHTVVPMNFRIVATARMISPDNIYAK